MVTQKEIIAALLGDETDGPMSRHAIAEWIEAHGIAPPDGWVLVPSEPTVGMKAAGNDAFPVTPFEITCGELSKILYKAMRAAAPKPEVKP